MEDNAISVTQISNYIRNIFLAEEMLINVSVYGEISGLNFSRDIAYFNLKDDGAILPCVCFENEKFNLLAEGNKVVVKGSPNYYVKGGRLSFAVSNVKPYGLGELYQSFLNLKNHLEKEGLFRQEIKKSLPTNIKRIGVATSATGAVIQDIINIRNRRNPTIDIVLCPCRVQGENADKEICNAIRLLDCTNVDLIIVARGGGSFEDLNCFNSEELAYTIYNTKKFVLSAVGHETDYTICDFVSDMRAPTPSAAAELTTENIQVKRNYLKILSEKIDRSFNYINIRQRDIITLSKSLIDKYQELIKNNSSIVLSSAAKISSFYKSYQNDMQYQYAILEKTLFSKNPKLLQDLGYVKIESRGKVINSVKNLNISDDISFAFYDGKVSAKIVKVEEEKNDI